MITKMFSVYDSKAKAFGVPFAMQTVGAAVRAFSDLANDNQTLVCRHPSDFILYEIGSFDDHSSELFWLSPGVHLGMAADFVANKAPIQYRPSATDPVAMALSNPLATAEELNGK